MATPKIDRMSVEFSKRIHDPVAAAATNGGNISADERTLFLNMAMMDLFNRIWLQVKGDIQEFAQILPELIKSRSITLTTSKYTIANPNLDYRALAEATVTSSNLYCTIRQASQKSLVESGRIPQMAGSATTPVAIEAGGVIYFYPAASFASESAVINIVTIPKDPTTGAFLAQGGSYDSPYFEDWENRIVEIAVELFDKDKGNIA